MDESLDGADEEPGTSSQEDVNLDEPGQSSVESQDESYRVRSGP